MIPATDIVNVQHSLPSPYICTMPRPSKDYSRHTLRKHDDWFVQRSSHLTSLRLSIITTSLFYLSSLMFCSLSKLSTLARLFLLFVPPAVCSVYARPVRTLVVWRRRQTFFVMPLVRIPSFLLTKTALCSITFTPPSPAFLTEEPFARPYA